MDAGEWKIMYLNIHSPDVVIFLVDKSICWKGSTHHKTKQKTNPRENRIGVVPIFQLSSSTIPFDKTCLRSFWYFVHLCPRKFPRASKPETYGFTKRKITNLLPSTIIVGDMFFCLCLDLKIKSSNDVDQDSKTKTLFQTSTHMHHTCLIVGG